MGLGSIGSLIALDLSQAGHEVEGFDLRQSNNERLLKIKIHVNSIESHLKINTKSKLSSNSDLVIVATKSYDLIEGVIEYLINSNRETLFVQNGVKMLIDNSNKTDNFHFGTVTGVESYSDTKVNIIIPKKCYIPIISGKFNDKISELCNERMLRYVNFSTVNKDHMVFYRKYIRWVMVSILNIFREEHLDKVIEFAGTQVVMETLDELCGFVKQISDCNLSSEDVFNDIVALPKELKTSAFRDYKKNTKSELKSELDLIVTELKRVGSKHDLIAKWKEIIK
jgi:ketopantoate reductase